MNLLTPRADWGAYATGDIVTCACRAQATVLIHGVHDTLDIALCDRCYAAYLTNPDYLTDLYRAAIPDGTEPGDYSDVPAGEGEPGRCPGCTGPCFDCGAIDMPALGRKIKYLMHHDRPTLLKILRGTQRNLWGLLAHAYAMEVGNTPSCDRQPTEPGILWLWSTLLRSAA